MENSYNNVYDINSLVYASADDGDWAKVPETVKAITNYLNNDQFAVLNSKVHPKALIKMVTEAFKANSMKETDKRYSLEFGHFEEIPAILFTDEIVSVYFAASDEYRVQKRLKLMIRPFVSLPESPPITAATAMGLFEMRIWVPVSRQNSVFWQICQAFEGYRSIYQDKQEALWAPGNMKDDLFIRLDAYFERLAICIHEGGLSEKEAMNVALKQLIES